MRHGSPCTSAGFPLESLATLVTTSLGHIKEMSTKNITYVSYVFIIIKVWDSGLEAVKPVGVIFLLGAPASMGWGNAILKAQTPRPLDCGVKGRV